MCTTDIFTYVHPDGRTEQTYRPNLCKASRHGRPCADEVFYQHPEQYLTYEDNTTSPFLSSQLPPTPTYTPRSSTPNYRSGDESDRSYHSGSSSSKKRASGVYINGKKVLSLEPERRHSRKERIVLVDNPPTPRTPPQSWTAPHTAPPSPNAYVVDAQPRESSSRRRPVIVDERPTVKIEVVDAPHRSKHSRHTSTSSRDSRHSYTDEEKEQRRRHREERKQLELEIREQKMRARIAEANAEIAGRPMVPAAPKIKRSSTYKRGAVEIHDREAEIADAVRRLSFEEARREDKARRIAQKEAEKQAAKEEEAQRQRLMERMMPRRRATVGPGSRRPRVHYDEGVYRWE